MSTRYRLAALGAACLMMPVAVATGRSQCEGNRPKSDSPKPDEQSNWLPIPRDRSSWWPTYTRFAYSDFVVEGGDTVKASFRVCNVGDRPGADVPQVYLIQAPAQKRRRLLGFDRVELQPGGVAGSP
jgi:hypothetical protein